VTVEKNTYATSMYIDAPMHKLVAYLRDGMSLNEYTLFSRMHKRIDNDTWLGTASGYQNGLYYHVRQRDIGEMQMIEWHCGVEHGKYFHVYPMLMFKPDYFGAKEHEKGTYYHWISFVDPARRTQMITEGLAVVHRAEMHSLKAQLERREGIRRPIDGSLELKSHTIYVEAPIDTVVSYLGELKNATEWGYLMRKEGERLFDEYDHPIEISVKAHDCGNYHIIEHDTHYLESGVVVRAPFFVTPSAYAFAAPDAPGCIVHRMTGWPVHGPRAHGKASPDDYDAEAINGKRIMEAKAGNMAAYARGCSYLPPAQK